MTNGLMGLQSTALSGGAGRKARRGTPRRRTTDEQLDMIVDTLTGTTTPPEAVARGEVDLAAHEVIGGTGEGFPFQQGGQLNIPGERLEAAQPAVVGVADALAAGVPSAVRAVASQAVKHGPGMVERAMDVFEASPLTPDVRMAAAPAGRRAIDDGLKQWDLGTPIAGKRNIQDFYAHHGITEPHEDIVRSANSIKGGVTGQDLIDAHHKREQLMQEVAHNPKPIKDMSMEELGAYGDLNNVNLRLTPIQKVMDPETGKAWEIPGGLDEPLSITDAYWLKSQAYDPNEMSDNFQAKLMNKLTAATTPEDVEAPFEMFNRALFGMQSPNTPLLTNQFMTLRTRVRSDDELNELASMIDWEPGEKVPAAKRNRVDREIGKRFGIEKGAEGGMGMRSSADLTNAAEMAKLYRDNPEFFRKKPEHTWQQHAERLIAVQRGLAPKTGSFGAVWEAPGQATTSAMDRHMARNFRPIVMDDPVLGPQIRGERVKLWNDQLKKTNQLKRKKNYTKAERDLLATLPPAGSKRVRSYDDILTQPGGDEWDLARVVTDATKHSEPKYRLASGAINPKVPEHLRDLPIEPEKVTLFGPIYNRMLEENQRLAKERGLSVFAEQWRVWDRIRKQVEPHESMHRDISKLPRMSAPELFDAYAHQKQAGFHSSGLKRSGERYVSPFDYRKGMAWGTGAAALPGLGMVLGGEEGDI